MRKVAPGVCDVKIAKPLSISTIHSVCDTIKSIQKWPYLNVVGYIIVMTSYPSQLSCIAWYADIGKELLDFRKLKITVRFMKFHIYIYKKVYDRYSVSLPYVQHFVQWLFLQTNTLHRRI